jgi:uncharacterized protein YndB with AHSA1/START domain
VNDPRDLATARTFAASPERVFAALTDPAELTTWWGPEGFTNTFHTFDLRPGGAWRFTMTAPDGATYEMDKQFVEITPPRRLVIDHLSPPSHRFRLTIDLEPLGDHTQVRWHMRFDSEAEAARVREVVTAANEENLDRHGQFLEG